MASKHYDVLIIGGGNAGMGVTVPTREAGLSVAMLEDWDLGGTCPNRGCTPKKVLVAAAHALHEIAHAGAHHIEVGAPSLDWAKLIDREKDLIKGIPSGLAGAMEKRGVEVIREKGRFVSPGAVQVGDDTIEAENIVIATGSTPRTLPIPGAELMITSDEVLSETTRPEEVVFVGGGVIALEFSHVYARAGAKVTILEVMPRLLPPMDADAVAQVHAMSEDLGIAIHTEVKVERIEAVGDRFRVVFDDGQSRTLEADRVINGAGRVANIEGLDLEIGEVELDRGRIMVDEALRSRSNPKVHVCGDALWSSPQLSPIATYEGRLVGRNIAEGARHAPDYRVIPSCVYTVPALASVGLTEQAASDQGLGFTAHVSDMSGWFATRTYAESTAWSKVLVDDASDQILGAHIIGHAGEELIHFFALAMRHGITASQVKDTIFGFPTFSADIKSMM